MDKSSRIHIAGHGGMVGSAIIRSLRARGFDHLLLRTRKELDLRDAVAENFMLAKIQMLSSSPPPEWAGSTRTALIRPNSSMRIWLLPIIRSTRPGGIG